MKMWWLIEFSFLEKSGIIGNVTHCAVSSEQYPGNACQFAKRWQSFGRRCSDNGRTRRRELLIKSKSGIQKIESGLLNADLLHPAKPNWIQGFPRPHLHTALKWYVRESLLWLLFIMVRTKKEKETEREMQNVFRRRGKADHFPRVSSLFRSQREEQVRP